MKYKGKRVNRHRYNQLTKSRDNYRKKMDELYHYFHPTALANLFDEIQLNRERDNKKLESQIDDFESLLNDKHKEAIIKAYGFLNT